MNLKDILLNGAEKLGIGILFTIIIGGCGGCLLGLTNEIILPTKKHSIVQKGIVQDSYQNKKETQIYGVCRYGRDVEVKGTFIEYDGDGNVVDSAYKMVHWYNRAKDKIEDWKIVSVSDTYHFSAGDSVEIRGVKEYNCIAIKKFLGIEEVQEQKLTPAMGVFIGDGENFKRSDNGNIVYNIHSYSKK